MSRKLTVFSQLLGVFWVITPIFADVAEQDTSQIRFTALTRSSGLSSDRILDIQQDTGQNIWIASEDGLNKFDGYGVTIYRKDNESLGQLSSNHLTSIACPKGKSGSIWLGTLDSGLNKFAPGTGKVEWFSKKALKGKNLLSDKILHLSISENKFLWIGTDRGLNVLDLLTEKVRAFGEELTNERISCISVLPDNQIWVGLEKGDLLRWKETTSSFEKVWNAAAPVTSLVVGRSHEIWIGTDGRGLFRYTYGNDSLPEPAKLQTKNITCLFNDHNAQLWVGTTHGLAKLDHASGEFTLFSHNPRDPESLVDDHVTKIFVDHSKMLWISTLGGGTSRFGLDQNMFPHIRKIKDGADSLPHPSVSSLHTSKTDNSIWIGTEKGLAKWSAEKGTLHQTIKNDLIENAYIITILEDSKKQLWMGTKGDGVILRKTNGTVLHFKNDPERNDSLPHNVVTKIFEDSEGQIWIGTSGGGVCIYRNSSATFTPVPTSSETIPTFVSDIVQDSNDTVWIGGKSGIYLHSKQSKSIQRLGKREEGESKNPLDSITTILPDDNGIIWVGTSESGFFRINSYTGEMISYNSSESDLPNNHVRSLIKDSFDNLWIGLVSGIAQLNIANGGLRVFQVEDGLQSKGFNVGSIAADSNQILYFGGPNGFNIINPSKLPPPHQPPIPILTGLEFFGKKVIPGKGEILEKNINQTDAIPIPFDKRNQFAITFANIGARYPTRGKFRYMLTGFDERWRPAKSDRRAQYSSLPAGKYRFKVQSSPDGIKWPDNTAKIDVIIIPPWHASWWFRSLLVLAAIAGTILAAQYLIRSRMHQIKRREEAFKAERDRAEAALARQLQHTMLIERTALEFKEGVWGDQVLSTSMKNFAEQFGASHCLIQQLVEEDDDGRKLTLIGQYNEKNISLASGKIQIDADLPYSKRTLEADEVVIFSELDALPEQLRKLFDSENGSSLMAVRTTFLEKANGIIILQRANNEKKWSREKIKLLQALSPQFGIAIAQITTANKEKEYRSHLKEARHDAEVANRAKSDFLAKMTHELRTPLNAIIGFTEIIQEDKTLNSRQRELVSIVKNSGEHLHDVINDILDLSKIEAGKLERNDEVFELAPMLKSLHEMLSMKAKEKKIGFEFHALTALPGHIETDKSKLRQTLTNLLNNAIKFTEKGSVTLKVRGATLSKPDEKDGKMRRRVRINFEIIDTGRGIAKNEIPKLFVKYSQTDSGRQSAEDGTGLGLPIAKSFIQLLGGDIKVDSVLGKGSSFQYYIDCEEVAIDPTSEEKISIALSEANAQKINGFSSDKEEIRILIAEDQPTNRLLLKKILAKAGFTLKEAINGQEALEKWEEWEPHLILMDEDMPIMRGSEATRLIKAKAKNSDIADPVIVALTAYAMEQAKQSAYDAGVQDFVAKPFRSHELFSVISKHLGLDYTFTDAA